MVQVQKGHFWMGDDYSKHAREKPAHWVDIAQDFELGQYPVTQALWEAVMGGNPSHFKDRDRPVERVSWQSIRVKGGFLDRLNALPAIDALNDKDGRRFALPTEAQWEYAAHCGQYRAAFPYEYAGSNYLPEAGWYKDNSEQESKPVGRKLANALSLYDMSGNVWEWCEDMWEDNYEDAPEDGSARVEGGNNGARVVRGGSWTYFDYNCRVTIRNANFVDDRYSNLGFRLARYRTTT